MLEWLTIYEKSNIREAGGGAFLKELAPVSAAQQLRGYFA